ncbi:hypothetical protein AGLY_015997 [Aphis glycines]|uniref:Uncharacterized protein n=1 Tax=Aphis glycines TaxID=307491 RepID=A0A6G0SZB9_APHGL|nr:hypothetical protein AGLY_015997 [Aphis glycines]
MVAFKLTNYDKKKNVVIFKYYVNLKENKHMLHFFLILNLNKIGTQNCFNSYIYPNNIYTSFLKKNTIHFANIHNFDEFLSIIKIQMLIKKILPVYSYNFFITIKLYDLPQNHFMIKITIRQRNSLRICKQLSTRRSTWVPHENCMLNSISNVITPQKITKNLDYLAFLSFEQSIPLIMQLISTFKRIVLSLGTLSDINNLLSSLFYHY